MIISTIVVRHSSTSIPGFFTNLLTFTATILIYWRSRQVENYRANELRTLQNRQRFSVRLFEQTATALVNAIDAKDTYSHGHSLRVAEYSEKIAQTMGKDEDECRKIYFAGLLHDVGKIGIPISIINKKGRLTEEEYDLIKEHPTKSFQILSSITEYPFLAIGAHYHHERYDGKGYPDKLKGEDIPEIARIISVADAYDAMSSNRSYRNVLPQQLVREEIVKGSGSQFDPRIAAIMQYLIDIDVDYRMRERHVVKELAGKDELVVTEHRSNISDGIHITDRPTTIRLMYHPEKTVLRARGPAVVLFDSLDERFHDDERSIRELNYYEYCELWFDGTSRNTGVRKIETKIIEREGVSQAPKKNGDTEYRLEAVRCDDHILVRVDDGIKTVEMTVALPDSTRFAYIGLTGEYCMISDVSITKSVEPVSEDYIPRIADRISFIEGEAGDVPNVQINGYRADASEGIPVIDGMKITFHTMSLPTARLIWHCPYFDLFYSDDRRVNGPGYREFALIRCDGESWDTDDGTRNKLSVEQDGSFKGWDEWKRLNKEGFDCTVTFSRKGREIITSTENFGLSICNTTTLREGAGEVYVALTGDQVALTNIRVFDPALQEL
ncbi:MAG: HD-GYP domain-containing protein [Lachnospiraceae bacterium]|nr:HD-GYP domain-containing protein [Lachnospiraceae bacterium]